MELTEEYIKSLTYPEYFERGVRYYKDGQVEIVTNDEDTVVANVFGSKKYKVTVDKNDLDCNCNCMAYSNKHYCKHVIAVLLSLLWGERKADRQDYTNKISKRAMLKKERVLKIKNGDATEICKQIKIVIKSQEKYWGNWDRYEDEQIEVTSRGFDLLDKIKIDFENMTKLLDLAKWYDKELGNIDDSDGTNQEFQMNIIFTGVKCALNISPPVVFEKIKPYLEYESNFDYSDTILEAFFEIKIPNEMAEYLGEYCQNTSSDMWNRCKEYWCKYLKVAKDVRFENMAKQYHDSNISILVMLIDYYQETGQNKKAIDTGWGWRSHFMVGDKILKLLESSDDFDRLIILLQERLTKNWNKDEAKLLKNRMIKVEKEKEFETFIINLVDQKYETEKLSILMFLRKYEDVAKIVIDLGSQPFINAEEYARKLAVLDKNSAKIIYWFLIRKEVGNFDRSSYYKRFWEYIEALKTIEDNKLILGYLREIKSNYPNKPKLIEKIINDWS